MARIQLCFEYIFRNSGTVKGQFSFPTGDSIFSLLKYMSKPEPEGYTRMHAMRVVLPQGWGLDIEYSKTMTFFQSQTGLSERLRISGGWDHSRSIVLRGQSSVLAKAADELIAACSNAVICRLGPIATYDYTSKQLWPVIDGAEDGGSWVPATQPNYIWVHREPKDFWVETAYEATPQPTEWTEESLYTYVTTLIFGRLRPERTTTVYGRANTDTDGIRVRMIEKALRDPIARRFMNTSLLKMVLQFMSRRGTHRLAAERLLKDAEIIGVPLDTDVYNILLKNYVANSDIRRFQNMLIKMSERFYYPNENTWLCYLDLLQSDELKLHVEAEMKRIGFFKTPEIQCCVGINMAGSLAYQAFLSGQSLDNFVKQQIRRFGSGWLTVQSVNAVLREFFLFHQNSAASPNYDDYRLLIDRFCQGDQKLDVSTANLILEHCAEPYVQDWKTTLWVLDHLTTTGLEAFNRGPNAPNAKTYKWIINLAMSTYCHAVLSTLIFYAMKARCLVDTTRRMLVEVFLGKSTYRFWRENRPFIMSYEMSELMSRSKTVNFAGRAMSGVEHVVLTETEEYTPAEPLAEALRAAFAQDLKNLAASCFPKPCFPDDPADLPAVASAAAKAANAADDVLRPTTISVPLVGYVPNEKPSMTMLLECPFDRSRMLRYPPRRLQDDGEPSPATGKSYSEEATDPVNSEDGGRGGGNLQASDPQASDSQVPPVLRLRNL